MGKQKSVIWIIIFLLITIFPWGLYALMGEHLESVEHENRKLEEKPVISKDNYEKFPQMYESYFNDNIPFRNQLVEINGAIDYFLFHQSSTDRVCIGQNGWLFYCDNEDFNPIEQSLGYWYFTEDELKQIADNLKVAEQVLSSKDIEFVLFIVPNKETIYKEELPEYYVSKSQYTVVDQLIDYLNENTNIRIVYPKEEMLCIKEEYSDIPLYYKLDTHWNNAGAYVGAVSLAKELGIELPPFSELDLKARGVITGDLAKMLNISIPNGDIGYDISWGETIELEEKKWEFSKDFIYHVPYSNHKTLVVRRDSFSTALAPIIATQFEDSIWIHMWEFKPQQIFDNNADVFVFETAERYVEKLLDFQIIEEK